MLPDIGFSLQAQYDRPITEMIALLKNAGFSAISPIWSPELDMVALTQCAAFHNMTVQSLHAPHKNGALLWQPDSAESAEVQEAMLRSIDACAQFHISPLVVHCWLGFDYIFEEESLDFRFFDHMVAYAQQKGVTIAFENLEGEEYLGALLTRYRDLPNVGYCWDSGHDHCYPHKTDFLKCYGDRLVMTHLNDNFGLRDPSGAPSGIDDLHFLPYDGNIDWDDALHRLSTAPKQTILNFEIKLRSHSKNPADLPYLGLPLEQFLKKAAHGARKIAQKYAEILSDAQ